MPTPASPQPTRLPTIFTRQGTTSLKNTLLILSMGYSSVYLTTRVVDWSLARASAYLPGFLASASASASGSAAKWPSLVSLARIGAAKVSVWSALKPCVAAGGRVFGRLTGGIAVGLCWLVPGIEADEFSIMIEDLPGADEEDEDQEEDEQEDEVGDGVEYQVGFDETVVE